MIQKSVLVIKSTGISNPVKKNMLWSLSFSLSRSLSLVIVAIKKCIVQLAQDKTLNMYLYTECESAFSVYLSNHESRQ